MRDFVISFIVGLFIGLIYGLIRVRSPAPPLVALIGLLGMVVGEALLPTLMTRFHDVYKWVAGI